MKLVFIRHGQSEYNLANIFTGWLDPKLSLKGHQEAIQAGRDLKAAGITFDQVYTSRLSRAVQTTYHVLEEMDYLYLPVEKSWRLNERHYGALQGLDKAKTAEKYGADQVHIWRRSFDVRPPQAEESQAFDDCYQDLDTSLLLPGESLKDTLERTLPYWQDRIAPDLKAGKNVLVVAHGNSLRSLTKQIEGLDDQAIVDLELATGQPIVYDFDDQLQLINKSIL
ncbi:phosphoglyceromutase [Aerococcus urinaehominis]|uniref:2,3-bisphosphoglycerate-dependent phosphoglycerate mutase n=1 Tax=Aerococcus urinaehominis TaxID=128944 RepID=A0A0X8FJS7_9LACT|nr:2,3-diphosphoglycerate-dependent phosphoglycerate mutase [Aerococcus urinaehominis]AMB98628.1 phosphoglyceromutase [Aerococcus urinaehominis]SDL95889.1 2,3-bisphosphoglycerate-dependent phosphoglycerate mutase [Aerococcus urinaehominis]